MVNVRPVSKNEMDSTVGNCADELRRTMLRCRRVADWIAQFTDADLTNLGYDETTRASIGSFRIAISDMEKVFQGQARENASMVPSQVTGVMEKPSIF